MRFPEFIPPSAKETLENELISARKELTAKNLSTSERNKILQRIIELEVKQAEDILGGSTEQEHMHFSGDSESVSSEEGTDLREKDATDLMEEKRQLEDAIQTYTEALEEAKQSNPADFELFKKLNGMLRGSRGVLELIEKELHEREEGMRAA